MESIRDELDFFKSLLKLIACQFGSSCEVVLHDFREAREGSYEKTVLLIENGHVTGRKTGECGTNLGLEVLRGTNPKGDRYGYFVKTKDHKFFRSSSLYVRNEKGEVIGALCVNWDITKLFLAEKTLSEFFIDESNKKIEEVDEFFANNVSDLLDDLLYKAEQFVGKVPEEMSRSDKVSFLDYLDKKGAFLISKSGNRVCDFLGISKYSLYSYLEEARRDE